MLKRTRVDYWCHGWLAKKTAKWLGAPDRPPFATMEEWNAFDKNQKTNFPLQERIENFLSWLQNVVMFPSDVVYTIRCYIRNRFRDKVHVLQTGLEPGKWHDYDTRLLHGMFNSFVLFIEDEQTIKNLEWELTLKNDYEWLPEEERAQQPDFGHPSPQAIDAAEKMALYTWWKGRPARSDPWDASGLRKFYEENKAEDDSVFASFLEDGDTVKAETRSILWKKRQELEEQYEREDDEMLIRLIKIRHRCWT